MKRFLNFALVLVMFFSVIAEVSALESDTRLFSMGNVGASVLTSGFSTFDNPASLYLRERDYSFVVTGSYADSFKSGSPYFFLSEPEVYGRFIFAGTYISLSLSAGIYPSDVIFKEGFRKLSLIQFTEMKLSLAAGLDRFGAGIDIYGGSSRQRIGVGIYDYSIAQDFIAEAFMGQYDKVLRSNYIQTDIGFMYDASPVSFGLMFRNVLDNDSDSTSVDWNSVVSNVDLGAYYEASKFSTHGRLNIWIPSFCTEIHNLFVHETRTLCCGFEISMQLLRDYSLSFRTGAEVPFVDFGQGMHTVGLGARIHGVDLSAVADIPFTAYAGQSEDGVCVTVSASMLF